MWSTIKTESNILETLETPETPETPTYMDSPDNIVEIQEPPKLAVKRFVKVANDTFNLCYVQPNPLPTHIEWLQKLNTEGLNFVKIPIDDKYEMLYMRNSITRLLKQTNLQWDYIDELINKYQIDECDENREALLIVVKVALDFCKRRNIEFLTEPIEFSS